jgi:hypothetical protein
MRAGGVYLTDSDGGSKATTVDSHGHRAIILPIYLQASTIQRSMIPQIFIKSETNAT